MTGIESIGRPATPRLAGRTPARAQGFTVPDQHHVSDQAPAEAAQAASLATMLTLQELSDGAVRDREARRHGHDMLAALAELQRVLLAGGDDAAALQRLEALAASVPLAADPRTAALLSAIVVRVRVELARRQL